MTRKKSIFEELEERKRIIEKAQDELFKKIAPEIYVERRLKKFESLTRAQIDYHSQVENFLASEREKIVNEINQSLHKNLKFNLHQKNLSRIVKRRFSVDPLTSLGSIKSPPGGRFNFGQTTDFKKDYFQALYVAEDFHTSLEESFHSEEESIGDFSHFKVEVHLSSYLDLRDKNVIEDFFNAIKNIKLPKEYDDLAKKYNVDPIDICSSAIQLEKWIFTSGYKAWDAWLDKFSPSQIFGDHCRRAGIQGIIYPSVRKDNKFNIAIFYENFENTTSSVGFQSPDEWPQIDKSRKLVNAHNWKEFLKSIA